MVQDASVTFIDLSDTTKKYSTLSDESGHYYIDIIVSSVESGEPTIPSKFELAQNYPNPFSSTNSIAYNLNQHAEPQITIYDLLGREVKKFTPGEQPAGTLQILWDELNNFGQWFAAAIYFYKFHANGETKIRKMLYGTSLTQNNGLTNSTEFPSFEKTEQASALNILGGNFEVRI